MRLKEGQRVSPAFLPVGQAGRAALLCQVRSVRLVERPTLRTNSGIKWSERLPL